MVVSLRKGQKMVWPGEGGAKVCGQDEGAKRV